MNTKRNALIISIFIICLFAASITAIYISGKKSDNARYAYIYQNNNLIKAIDLTKVDKPYTFTVTGENQCYNVIEVRKGSIGITEASCPDGLCCSMGFISTPAMPVTCLPNHLFIKLSDDNPTDNVDIIAY